VSYLLLFGLSFSTACTRLDFMTSMSCDSVCCMCGQHGLEQSLVEHVRLCAVVRSSGGYLDIPCDQFAVLNVGLYFMFHTKMAYSG